MAVFIIIWIICGITTAVIGNSKGRDPIGWFFIGAIGGIFGLVAVCAMPGLGRN